MKHLWMLLLALTVMFFAVSCDEDDGGTGPTPVADDLVGNWLSAGDNVAYILSYYFAYDSIWAEFNEDNTYEVLAKDTSETITTFTGTYTTEKSEVEFSPEAGYIYTITLNQTTPTALTSQGIYWIDMDEIPNEMWYEVVQTEPDIQATPPTPEAGFGSSNGGALGLMNLQTFIRLD